MVFVLILGNFGGSKKFILFNINEIRAVGRQNIKCSAKIFMVGIDRKHFSC